MNKNSIDFQIFISGISASFINIPLTRVDDMVEHWLKKVTIFFEVERCGIALFDDRLKTHTVTHSYTAPGFGSEKGLVIDQLFPFYYQQLVTGKIFKLETIPEGLPKDAIPEREFCLQAGIEAVLSVPLVYKKKLFGNMAMASFHEYDFIEGKIQQFKIISEIFMNTLIRKQAEESLLKTNEILRESEKQLRHHRDHLEMLVKERTIKIEKTQKLLLESKDLLDATGKMARVGGWELDAETLEVKWTEQTYRIYELPLDYKLHLKEVVNFFHPDDRETLSLSIQKALEHGEGYDMEIRFVTAKGKKLWTRTVCNPQIVDGKVRKLKGTFQDITEQKQLEIQRVKLIRELQDALEEVKTLSGLLPICASCKKIRDDKGYWDQIESYVQKHSTVKFSHGMCPECSDNLYGKEDWYIEMKKKSRKN